jgi:hypothetical protein
MCLFIYRQIHLSNFWTNDLMGQVMVITVTSEYNIIGARYIKCVTKLQSMAASIGIIITKLARIRASVTVKFPHISSVNHFVFVSPLAFLFFREKGSTGLCLIFINWKMLFFRTFLSSGDNFGMSMAFYLEVYPKNQNQNDFIFGQLNTAIPRQCGAAL